MAQRRHDRQIVLDLAPRIVEFKCRPIQRRNLRKAHTHSRSCEKRLQSNLRPVIPHRRNHDELTFAKRDRLSQNPTGSPPVTQRTRGLNQPVHSRIVAKNLHCKSTRRNRNPAIRHRLPQCRNQRCRVNHSAQRRRMFEQKKVLIARQRYLIGTSRPKPAFNRRNRRKSRPFDELLETQLSASFRNSAAKPTTPRSPLDIPSQRALTDPVNSERVKQAEDKVSMRITLAVFGVYHHFELGHQLHQRGHLQKIYSTWPWARLKREGLPRSLVSTFPLLHTSDYLLNRALSRTSLYPPAVSSKMNRWSTLSFDRWTAAASRAATPSSPSPAQACSPDARSRQPAASSSVIAARPISDFRSNSSTMSTAAGSFPCPSLSRT